jgi:hypothetical protein
MNRQFQGIFSLLVVMVLSVLASGCGGSSDVGRATSTTSSSSVSGGSGGIASVQGWTECASEGGTCSFSGAREIRYGTTTQNVTKVLAADVQCSNGTFGDPAVGVLKTCWYGNQVDLAATAPTTTTTTTTTATVPTTTTTTTTATAPTTTTSGTAGPRVTTFTASGPIKAVSGQVISGVRIQNANGPCITIPAGATGVIVRDSDIGPCAGNANIFIEGANATVEYSYVHHGNRGVMAYRTSGTLTRMSKFDTFYGPKFNGTAIEYDYMGSGVIDGNVVTGSNYASDAVSVFDSSNIRLINNNIDITVAEPSAAAFTMGDSATGTPGSNNYVSGNIVRQSGGVPAGVFGSSGNTLLENNCLTHGIQAYNYSGVFVDVTVRNNVINIGASFVPDTSIIKGWSTNINSTNCSLLSG